MDKFKQKLMQTIGPGGLSCSCCNSFDRKAKPKLNRIARARIKHEDMKYKK